MMKPSGKQNFCRATAFFKEQLGRKHTWALIAISNCNLIFRYYSKYTYTLNFVNVHEWMQIYVSLREILISQEYCNFAELGKHSQYTFMPSDSFWNQYQVRIVNWVTRYIVIYLTKIVCQCTNTWRRASLCFSSCFLATRIILRLRTHNITFLG